MQKLVLGSANFYKIYGLQKIKIKNFNNKKKILELLKNFKIEYLDTAIDYKFKSSLIKKSKIQKLKIITKIKLSKNNKKNNTINFKKNIKKELKKFKIKSLDYVLLHNPDDLYKKEGKNLLANLKKFKKIKIIKKIGVSIYEPKELKNILLNFKPDLIQVPLNIFDTRILKSKYFNLIKNKKIEIQARSIFLQGLILKKQKELRQLKVNPLLVKKIKTFENWCLKNQISKLGACINFVKKIKHVKYLTIGVNSPDELSQIFKEFDVKREIRFKNFAIKNYNIIDPRNW